MSAPPLSTTSWEPPRLAAGVTLFGEYEGSGFRQPTYLVRRADGRMLQVSALLHELASRVDGQRGVPEIAASLTTGCGRTVTAENVAYLIEHKLRPLGIVAGGPAERPRSGRTPALGLSLRTTVVPERVVAWVARLLLPLFRPPVVVAALLTLVAVDAQVLFLFGLADALARAFAEPLLLLVVWALTVAGAAFHELGHATASQYGGARPGPIGIGVYLIWPAFFNDLTGSYRLDRAGRIRADLGGVYFNVLFILFLAGLYGLTAVEPLLLVIALQHVAILQQFLPFLRLDGYYVLSDAVGVPDLFSRIRPILGSVFRRRRRPPAVTQLKPRTRAVVTVWVLLTVPLLVAVLVVAVVRVPVLAPLAWEAAEQNYGLWSASIRARDVAGCVVSGLHLLILGVPVAGLSVALTRTIRRAGPGRSRRGRKQTPDPAFRARGFSSVRPVPPWGVHAGRAIPEDIRARALSL